MAGFSQVSQKKRGRDEYLNNGLASPDAKRTVSGTLGHDSDLMALLDKIDTMDNRLNITILEDAHMAMNEAEDKMRINGVIKCVEDEIWLQTDHNNMEFTDERGSTEQMGSKKQDKLTADWNSEAAWVRFDTGDFPYYNDVGRELGFFVDNVSLSELGILQNRIDEDSIRHIMYSDVVHDYVETTEVFSGYLWEDDIWQ